uniref:Uncharacterized protein n=1 Tax=Glossina palpalis gambiensis TaxID=67801 RepID=A0A1B0BU98_9MUSC
MPQSLSTNGIHCQQLHLLLKEKQSYQYFHYLIKVRKLYLIKLKTAQHAHSSTSLRNRVNAITRSPTFDTELVLTYKPAIRPLMFKR